MKRYAMLLLLWLGTTTGDLVAEAQAPPEPAAAEAGRERYRKGRAHYDAYEYDRAIEEFQAGYELTREPLFLFNIGQANRLKGNCAQAMQFYRRYLEEEPEPTNLQEVDAAMKLCDPNASATPRPDGGPPAPARPDPAPPGATPTGIRPQRGPSDPGSPHSRRALYGWMTGGAGLALAAVGFGFGASARSLWSDAKDMCDDDLVCTPAGDALADRARTRATIATVLTGAGVAVIAAGVILVVTAPRQGAARSGPTRIVPAADASSVGLALTGRF